MNHCALAQQGIIIDQSQSALADSYKVLRTQITQRVHGLKAFSLMVTSAQPEEGKTFTALNIAISFAQEIDRSVLYLEADLRKPGLMQVLGLDLDLPGLADYLLDNRPIEELLLSTDLERLHLLTAGRAVPNSAELLGSQRMKDLVHELKHSFHNRLIIIDAPPVLTTADALVCSDLVEAIVVVVEAGRTAVDQVKRAEELLQERNLIGLVLNKVRQY